MKKRIIYIPVIVILASLIGIGLLTLSFSLPESSIQSNAKISSISLSHEELYPKIIDGIEATQMDNSTDAIMINSASFNYGDYSAIERAAGIFRFEVDWSNNQIVNLYEHFNDEEAICDVISYSRYWHGYITLLRPLLVMCNVAWIRFLQFILHIALLIIFISLLKEKTGILNSISINLHSGANNPFVY